MPDTLGFPMGTYIAATERILEIDDYAQRVGKAYLTSPFLLRFCKASAAFLSMMFANSFMERAGITPVAFKR